MIIELFVYFSLIFFTFGQLGRISFYGQQVNLYVFEIIFLINLSFLIIRYGFDPIKKGHRRDPVIFFFFIWLLISYFAGIGGFSRGENSIGFLYWVRLCSYFLYFFYLGYHIEKNIPMRKRILKAMTVCGILILFATSVQYFLYPDLRNLWYLGWDPHLYRIFGLFFDPSVAAAIFGLFFFLFIFKRKFILAAFFFLAIMLTFSRTGYTAFILVVLYLFLKEKRYLMALGFIVFFIVVILVLPKPKGEGVNLRRIYSIDSRIEDYKNAVTIWKKNPLLGVGYNRIRFLKQSLGMIDQKNAEVTHAGASFHSSFLILLASGGIIGLVLFIAVLYRLSLLHGDIKAYVLFLSFLSFGDNIILHTFILFLLIHLILVTILLFDTKR